jgi:hypothetical protein
VLALALALSACGGGDDKPKAGADASASSSPSAAPSPGSTPSAGPKDDTTTSAAPSAPPDPVLKTYKRVLRGGKQPRSTVTAPPATFKGTVRYGDGVSLAVTDVNQAKVTGQGPGEFPGEPKTQITLRMTNGGDKPVRLDQVVVTAIYGSPRRQARPVYDDRSRDFTGVLKAGSSTTAVYSFSIPKGDLGRVTMIVDFDGKHTVATFQGDPRSAD